MVTSRLSQLAGSTLGWASLGEHVWLAFSIVVHMTDSPNWDAESTFCDLLDEVAEQQFNVVLKLFYQPASDHVRLSTPVRTRTD